MKIIISESRSIKIMKSYIDRFFPTLSGPFISEQNDEYCYFPYILYVDINGSPIIKETLPKSSSYYNEDRFYVTSELEPLYLMFGKKLFEEYFRQVHNIYLSNPKGSQNNWIFDEL